MVVPEELRHIIGRNELVQIGLPDNARAREKMAIGVVNAFQAQLHEAREVWDSLREASIPTLSTAAKVHFQSELAFDDLERAAPKLSADEAILRNGRSTYASRLRLLAQVTLRPTFIQRERDSGFEFCPFGRVGQRGLARSFADCAVSGLVAG